jgi:hypothetical protein
MDSNVFVNGVMMLSQWNRTKLQHTPNGIVLSVQVDLDSYAKDPTGYTWANLFFTSCGFGSNIRNNTSGKEPNTIGQRKPTKSD